MLDMDLKSLEKWIYRELKIDLSAYKSNQMNRRLNSIMSRSGAATPEEYIRILDGSPVMRKKLADFITINVSEFFRNRELFSDLEDKIKKLLLSGKSRIKMWSAACSNGAEPYTMAIIMDRLTPGARHTIIGTDIDATILDTARKGEYGANEVKGVDPEYLARYFKYADDKYILNQDIRNRVEFRRHDLILEPYERGFDLILCRNVVIYFNSDIKDKMYKKFYDSLNPGGMLFVGATESIHNYREFGFEKASTFIYRKNN
jgi:chemotaxis protein methyltransferase CheR